MIKKYCEKNNIIECSSKKEITVLNLRRFLNVNNLATIERLPIIASSFRASKTNKVNIYVLYAWQKLCEYYTKEDNDLCEYNKEKLITNIENIKSTMFLPVAKMFQELKKFLNNVVYLSQL